MARPTVFTSEIPGFDVDSKLLDAITGVASLDLEVSRVKEPVMSLPLAPFET